MVGRLACRGRDHPERSRLQQQSGRDGRAEGGSEPDLHDEQADEEGKRPRHTEGKAAIAETESGLGDRPHHGANGGGRGESRTMIDREEERDGARREREPDDPAAHALSPSAPGQARRPDEGGCDHELEDQALSRSHGIRRICIRAAAATRVASSAISTEEPRTSPVRPPRREAKKTAQSRTAPRERLSKSALQGPKSHPASAQRQARYAGAAQRDSPAWNRA